MKENTREEENKARRKLYRSRHAARKTMRLARIIFRLSLFGTVGFSYLVFRSALYGDFYDICFSSFCFFWYLVLQLLVREECHQPLPRSLSLPCSDCNSVGFFRIKEAIEKAKKAGVVYEGPVGIVCPTCGGCGRMEIFLSPEELDDLDKELTSESS